MDEIKLQLKAIQRNIGFLFPPTEKNAHIPFSEAEVHSLQSLDFDFDVDGVFDGKTYAKRSVAKRQGQAEFRKNMLVLYNGACAITGNTEPTVLDAAHIIPFNGRQSNHPRNGILLRTDIHTLFDAGLIAIDPETLCVRVSSKLSEPSYLEYNNRQIELPLSVEFHPSKRALRHHIEFVYRYC